ncbi:phosphoenolpyruvate carboxykinase (GTP), partial [Burkholderia contaminans]
LEGAGAKLPKIYCVNWFRKDANGKFVWPGFGENMRVLKWMLDRLEGTGGGGEHAFGVSPAYEDLHWDGLDFTREQFDAVTAMNADEWREELKLHAALFDTLKLRLPAEMTDTMKKIEQRIGA